MANLNEIFGWFSIGKTPTAEQFKQSWSSFRHKSEKIEQTAILGLNDALENKANKEDVAVSLLYLPDVPTKDALYTTYPNPMHGEASLVLDEGYIYQFRSDIGEHGDWVKTPFKKFPENVLSKEDVYILNLLNPDLSNFYLDKRLSANGGILTDNNPLFPFIVTCKGIPITANKPLAFSGSMYIYIELSPRGSVTTNADFTGNRVAPVWERVDGGWKVTSPMSGYLFADFELTEDLTELKLPSQIEVGSVVSKYIPYGQEELKLPSEVLVSNDVKNTLGQSSQNPIAQQVVTASLAAKADNALLFALLTNDLSGFYLDKRLSANGGNIISNSTSQHVVLCKSIPVSKDKEYEVIGAWYNYVVGGIRGLITSDITGSNDKNAPVWEQTEKGYKCKAPIDGYLFVDFELNMEKTALRIFSEVNLLDEIVEIKTLKPEVLKPTVLKQDVVSDINDESREKPISQFFAKNGLVASEKLLEIYSKNQLNPSFFRFDRRYSTGEGKIIAADNNLIAFGGLMVVKEGQTYTASGDGIYSGRQGGYFADSATDDIGQKSISNITFKAVNGGIEFTVPKGMGIKYAVVSLATNADHTALAGNAQVESGNTVTEYEPYEGAEVVKKEMLDFFEVSSKNMMNPADFKFDRRYSTGSRKIIVADVNLIGSGGLRRVQEGVQYHVSGDGVFGGWQGGYFGADATDAIGQESIDNITFANPVTGKGKYFEVPKGMGIKYALVSIATNADHTQIAGDIQMEVGEMATDYEPYQEKYTIKKEYIPSGSGGGNTPTSNKELEKYTTLGSLVFQLFGKLPKFVKYWVLKCLDIVIVGTGTSLDARTIEHHTEHKNAKFRPPLMHSNNLASHIWDALSAGWNQQYRRYDSMGEAKSWCLREIPKLFAGK